MEVVASLSEGRTAAAQCGLFTHKSVPVMFEPPCTFAFRPYALLFTVRPERDVAQLQMEARGDDVTCCVV